MKYTIRIVRRRQGKDERREVFGADSYFVDRIPERKDAVQVFVDGGGETGRDGAKVYTIENEDKVWVMNADGNTVDNFDRNIFKDRFDGRSNLR